MFSVQQLLDNWIQSLQKNSSPSPVCGAGMGGDNVNVATHCLPGLSLHQAFNPSRDPGCSSGLLHVGPPTAQGWAGRGSLVRGGALWCHPAASATSPISSSVCITQLCVRGGRPIRCSVSSPAASRPADTGLRRSLERRPPAASGRALRNPR